MSAAGPKRRLTQTVSWGTPQFFMDLLAAEGLTFDLDTAAEEHNKKAPYYLTGPCLRLEHGPAAICHCGLCQPWAETGCKSAWNNPPYSWVIHEGQSTEKRLNLVPYWLPQIAEARERGMTVAALLPSATGANWFKFLADLGETRLLSGRLPFDHPPGCTCSSCAAGKPVASPAGDNALFILRPGPTTGHHLWIWDWRKDLERLTGADAGGEDRCAGSAREGASRQHSFLADPGVWAPGGVPGTELSDGRLVGATLDA